MRVLQPDTVDELGDLLRSQPGRLRIVGAGSHQDRLPDAGDAARLDLSALAAIERLDAPDQTCTVGVGVRRHDLDDALHECGLELPCLGDGTLGGLFASDPIGAATVGGASPRTLLLGMTAMLADGTPFQSGARVVKSVAGFDVHKLLVGSRGRLFAATRLHLRLKPLPRASAWFAATGLELENALARFVTLRSLAVPPAQLHLLRTLMGWTLAGRFTGRGSFVAGELRRLNLPDGPPFTVLRLDAPSGGEVLTGIVTPSVIARLLAAVPADSRFLMHGGGRFEVATPTAAATDALLAKLPAIGAHACIADGAPERRGLGTPLDDGQRRLGERLEAALNPDGILV